MSVISKFQREKLEYYFKFFDTNGDHFIEPEDLPRFMRKILNYTGWKANSSKAQTCYEIHATFFEVLKEKTLPSDHREVELKVSIEDWLNLWDGLLPGCMGMHNFPIWLRLLPKSMFQIIDKKNDGYIDKEESAEFYEKFINFKPEDAKTRAKEAYSDMTDNGRYPLDLDGYEQIFANFLLGRTPYGPGRFIFGGFESAVKGSQFSLIQPAYVNPESESEPEEEPPVPAMTEDGRPLFY